MKLKRIDFTDNYKDLLEVIKLADFLEAVGIAYAAVSLRRDAMSLHNEIYCSDCEYERDQCKCYQGGRYAQEYDDEAYFE